MSRITDVALVNSLFCPEDLLKQMDEIFLGNRKACSTLVMSREYGTRLTDTMLRYVFEDYLDMSPEQVRDNLTHVMVERFKLRPFIHKRIPCPVELDGEKELQYIAWHLYPWTRNAEPYELIIKIYMEILHKKRKKYPKGFFDDADGEKRAIILLKTMINEYICPESIEYLYELFANDRAVMPILNKYALKAPLLCIYNSPLDYLHESLGKQGDESLYAHYSNLRTQKAQTGTQPVEILEGAVEA